MVRRIYLDYAASTPVAPEVFDAMRLYFSDEFGNPSSVHAFGQDAIAAVDRSRETIAKAIGAAFRQVVFTASATEANNLAINGALFAASRDRNAAARTGEKPRRIVVSAIEHESIREAAALAARHGVEVVVLPAGRDGWVDEKDLKGSLTPETVIVSILYANNEIGTVQRITSMAAIIREFREKSGGGKYPLFHTDAAQAFQFLDCNVKNLGVDLMTLSAHKIYGPKGAGALYIKDLSLVEPLIEGGGQEFGLRSGTENVPAMVGFARAVECAAERRASESARLAVLRERLWKGIKTIVPEAAVNGPADNAADPFPAAPRRLPNILNVHFPGRSAQDLLVKLDLAGLAASSGSACRSRALEASYVIEALGYSKVRAKESIRFSLGHPTTEEEIDRAIEILARALA